VADTLGTYPIRTFDDFRNVAQLYQYSRTILTALELDLFTAIGGRTRPIAALAHRVRADQRGLDILCRNLAALGLLVKRGSSYRNTPLARVELNRRSAAYRGAYLDLITNHWHAFTQLTNSVRSGKPLDADEPESPAWRRSFTWAMHHRSREQAKTVARFLDLRRARTLLDLGGGPGTYAMAFLAANPALHATVADRPAALKVARTIAATHPAKARLSFARLDFMSDPLPGRYDVVWLSNIIHIYAPAQNVGLFRKIRKALTPAGRLIIHDSFLTDPHGLYPIDTTAFALTMLLFTDTGDTYASRDVMRWLRKAGYRRVRLLREIRKRKDGENALIEGRR
jgi:SAM-dependent methyltransferase